jgi:hypothetical protein
MPDIEDSWRVSTSAILFCDRPQGSRKRDRAKPIRLAY